MFNKCVRLRCVLVRMYVVCARARLCKRVGGCACMYQCSMYCFGLCWTTATELKFHRSHLPKVLKHAVWSRQDFTPFSRAVSRSLVTARPTIHTFFTCRVSIPGDGKTYYTHLFHVPYVSIPADGKTYYTHLFHVPYVSIPGDGKTYYTHLFHVPYVSIPGDGKTYYTHLFHVPYVSIPGDGKTYYTHLFHVPYAFMHGRGSYA